MKITRVAIIILYTNVSMSFSLCLLDCYFNIFSYFFLHLLSISRTIKPATDAESTALSEQIAQQLQADIVAQYVSDLQKRMAVSLNQTAIDQATGAAAITPN